MTCHHSFWPDKPGWEQNISEPAFGCPHGSWNRSEKIGYDITLVKIENNESKGMETFATGWLDDTTQKAWGRPVDVLILTDGSMLVSYDTANVIYRISYGD